MKKTVTLKNMKTPLSLVLCAGMSFVCGLPAWAADVPVQGTENQVNPSASLYKGKVTDMSGEELPGVTVQNASLKKATVSDVDGNFSIQGNKGDKIIFSMVGFSPKTITLGSDPILEIVLSESAESLNEVVVVGYGTQKKENLTGAVLGVTAKELEDRPITNLSQGLQGLIGNLNISASDGTPGRGFGFNVRGTTSVNSSGPLVLVDGVQMDPNMINPADVESVSVLKDAASASIYGTQAAYGVVLITTKKGKEQKPKLSFSANLSWNRPTRIPEYMDSWTFANFHNLTNRNSGGGDYYDQTQMEHIYAYYTDPAHNLPVYIDPSNPDKYIYCGNTDWIHETRKNTTLTQQYNVSVSGGTGKTTYYASAGFMDQEGQLKHYDDKYQRFNASMNINSQVLSWLNVGMKANYNYTNRDTPYGSHHNDMGSSYYGADLRPFMPVYHPDGNYSGQGSWTNMVATQALSGSRVHKENDLWLTGILKIVPLKDWNINLDYTRNIYSINKKYHGKEIVEHYANPDVTTIFPHITPSTVKYTNDNNYYDALNIFTDYTRDFGLHNVKVLLGYNYEHHNWQWFDAERQNLISPDVASLGMAYGEKYNGSGTHASATEGFFGRINYNYDNRYLVEVNGRYDGSSKFPKKKRYAFFPSFSLGWRLSGEKFWEPVMPYVNELKFRGSYGKLGNQSVGGDYPYIATMGANGEMGYLIDGKKIACVGTPGLVSPFLTWETVKQFDFGVDFGALNNRLFGSFDWYRRITEDMVTNGVPLPAVLGTGAPQANTADLRTDGWELNIGWRDRLPFGLSYDVSLVLSDYKATITKFNNPEKLISNHYVGKVWGEIWGFETEGLFQSEEEVAAHADQSEIYGGGWYPGDVKYRDLNGDGKIGYGRGTVDDPGDRKIIGNSEPRYAYGIKINAAWKGFDLNLFFQGIGKRDVELGGNQFWGFGNEWHVPFKHALDSWTEDNRDAYFPRSTYDNVTGNRVTQSRYLQDASYFRLKNLTLGYTLPEKWMSKIGFDSVRFYFSGQNLFTIDHLFDIYDPETLGLNSYPLQKSFSLGVTVTL